MTNTKITAESFLDNKELREEAKARIEVLDKVKQLFLIPKLECMTVTQVAEYFEVPSKTITSQYNYNKDEFDGDGVHLKSLNDFRSLSDLNSITLKTVQRRGFLEIVLSDNTTVTIPNCGIKCFPKRAILRMGMLLRDSVIAKEVRTQLLNTFEHTTEEQRTAEIDQEENLVSTIIRAALKGDQECAIGTFAEYIGYKNRYIAKIEQHNAELAQENAKISEQKKKIDKVNNDLKVENHVLATDVLKWTDRATVNRLVRVLAGKLHRGFADTYNLVYHELLYKYSISLKNRAAKVKKKNLPLIAFVKDDEWVYLYKVVAAICNKCNLNLNKLFRKAKIDVSDLDLTDIRYLYKQLNPQSLL